MLDNSGEKLLYHSPDEKCQVVKVFRKELTRYGREERPGKKAALNPRQPARRGLGNEKEYAFHFSNNSTPRRGTTNQGSVIRGKD